MQPPGLPIPPKATRSPAAKPAELHGLTESELEALMGPADHVQFYARRPAPEDGWFGPGTGKIERGRPALVWTYRCFGPTVWSIWLGWREEDLVGSEVQEKPGFFSRMGKALGLMESSEPPPSRPRAEARVKDVVQAPWNAVY